MKSFQLSNPIKPGELELAYAQGMVKLSDLKDGVFYAGNCRNAHIAMWHGPTQRFIHQRSKWGSDFLESINCPENDDGYDIFTPSGIAEPDDALKAFFAAELADFLAR